MRLDHLLSKEQVHRSSTVLFVRTGSEITGASHTRPNGLGGAHGWNIDIDVELNGSNSVLISVVYSVDDGKVCSGRVCICTLLGPEGPERFWLRPGVDCSFGPFSVSIIWWRGRVPPVL